MHLYREVKDLVLLHGFLGAPEDWKGVIASLEEKVRCHPIALPRRLSDFPDQLQALCLEECLLAGYSMGGRIALMLYALYPERIKGLALLSAHFGLKDQELRHARWETDLLWIDRLRTLPLSDFLALWYAQPLFGGFTPPEQRYHLDPNAHAELLYTYSLARQPVIDPPEEALYLYGEKDLKYAALYHTLRHSAAIAGCAHAIHLENPGGVAHALDEFWHL